MSTPYIQPTQTGAKCPHGLPPGACPICSGMGGGGGVSKNKNKPRVPGEMSYNECMAAWVKIQAARDAKIQDRIDLKEAMAQRALSAKEVSGLDKALKALDKFIEPLPQPVKAVIKAIATPVINLISKIPVLVKNIQTFALNLVNFTLNVAEKLASVLGEAKNFIQTFFTDKAKKIINNFFSIFSAPKNADNEEDEDIIDKIKKLFKIKPKEEIKKVKKKNQKAREDDEYTVL